MESQKRGARYYQVQKNKKITSGQATSIIVQELISGNFRIGLSILAIRMRFIKFYHHMLFNKWLNYEYISYRELSLMGWPSKVQSMSGSGSPTTTQSIRAVLPSRTSASTNFSRNFGAAEIENFCLLACLNHQLHSNMQHQSSKE